MKRKSGKARRAAKHVPVPKAHPGPSQPPALIEVQTPTLGLPIEGATPTALHLPPDLDKGRWERIGEFLWSLGGALQWWIGDYLHYGTARGYITRERYDIAEAHSGYERHYLWNLAYVAGKVQTSRRREDLAWALHAEVASLPADDQERLLAQASQNTWTREQLRAAVKELKKPGHETSDEDHTKRTAGNEAQTESAKRLENESKNELTNESDTESENAEAPGAKAGMRAFNKPEEAGTAVAKKPEVASEEPMHHEDTEKAEETVGRSDDTMEGGSLAAIAPEGAAPSEPATATKAVFDDARDETRAYLDAVTVAVAKGEALYARLGGLTLPRNWKGWKDFASIIVQLDHLTSLREVVMNHFHRFTKTDTEYWESTPAKRPEDGASENGGSGEQGGRTGSAT